MTEHTLTAVGVVMDCADPEHLADFWQEAIGFENRSGDGEPYVTLSGSSLRRPLNHLTLQRVPEPKSVKNRTHVDLFARDVPAEIERLVALGGTVTSTMPEDGPADAVAFAVMGDPEGNEFCVIARPSSSSQPSETPWTSGARSLARTSVVSMRPLARSPA